MKLEKYIYPFVASVVIMFGTQSCFQDMDDAPSFNYPKEPENPVNPEPEPPVSESNVIFKLGFDNGYVDSKSSKAAIGVGTPSFGGGIIGEGYGGANKSYLTFNMSDLKEKPGSTFSIAFWYKLNNAPDRAGIISVTPPTEGAGANSQNNRTAGFRLLREASGDKQILKANIGQGDADAWLVPADANALTTEWTYVTMTVATDKATLYLNGKSVAETPITGISWKGCDIMSIGSGAPRFNEWNHLSDMSGIDEISIYNKTLTTTEISSLMAASPTLKISDMMFYAPFNSSFVDAQGNKAPEVIGSPTHAAGKVNSAYQGATAGYLKYNVSDFATAPASTFSVGFWYQLNNAPDRAGIISITPVTEGAGENAQNNRTTGFRLLREGGADKQILKANIGQGDADAWLVPAEANALTTEWTYVTLTIATDKAILYLNGKSVIETPITGISWKGCDIMSIGSGAPRFNEWNHLSDLSLIDEVRMFNKVLTADEIATIISFDNKKYK